MRMLPALVALVLGLAGVDAHATNRDLCVSVPGECEYSGPNAPVLATTVCWFRSTSTTKLMTGATCPTGGWPYFVKYGVVDPLTLEVTGFVPLEDGCAVPGLCSPSFHAPESTWSAAMCCIDGTCWPHHTIGGCEGGELFYCSNGVTNEDGTVECFDDHEV